MKKIFSFIALALIAMVANAEEDVTLKPASAQPGTTAKVGVEIKHDAAKGPVANIIFFYNIPDGTTLSGITALGGGTGDYNPVNRKCLYEDFQSITSANPDGAVVCTLDIEIPETMAFGEYPVSITDIAVVYDDGKTDFKLDRAESTITVQKTAVIEPQDPNYTFEIVPFVTEAGKTYTSAADNSIAVPVLLKNADYVSDATFNLTLPAGFGIASYKSGMKTTTKKPEVASSRSFNVSEGGSNDLVVNQSASGNVVTYTLTSTGDGDFVLSEGSGELCKVYLTTASTVEPGVYTIKIDNISITSTPDGEESTTHVGGEYLASVIVGQPAAQEAILYGDYSSSVASAFSTALKNVAIADVTAATVAGDAKFVDVLVNEKGGNSYYTRTSENYGTTVLPLDLTTANVDELYMIESMDANSIVLTEKANVSANTPCIFKGTINVEGATPTLGVPSEQGLGQTTFKGTYSATNIAAGEGYYISSNGKFYGDGATVRPFRGYFDGAIAGVKSFSVFVNTANGLVDITNQLSDEAIYSLQGIRTQTAKKGVNIVGGKKVYIK